MAFTKVRDGGDTVDVEVVHRQPVAHAVEEAVHLVLRVSPFHADAELGPFGSETTYNRVEDFSFETLVKAGFRTLVFVRPDGSGDSGDLGSLFVLAMVDAAADDVGGSVIETFCHLRRDHDSVVAALNFVVDLPTVVRLDTEKAEILRRNVAHLK